jgi:hypothetical protein
VNISIGFTKKDAVRAVWTFLFAALGYLVIVQPKDLASWKVAAVAAVAAGVSAVKNLLLGESTLKG